MASKPTEVLGDHKRRRKRLVPPLLSALGEKHSPYSWTRELVPEFLWVWLIIDLHGLQRGCQLAARIGNLASRHASNDPKPLFARNSSFSALTVEQKEAVVRDLGADALAEINLALTPMFRLIGGGGMEFLDQGQEIKSEQSDAFRETINALYDRHGRPTALTLATGFFMGLEQDKIKIFADLAEKVREDFKHIVDYPKTENSKRAGSSFRAAAPMFLIGGDEGGFKKDDDWLKFFWEKVGRIGPCSTSVPSVGIDRVPADPLGQIVFSFRNAAQTELRERLELWGFDLHSIETTEVVGALLARQTILAADFALAPTTWTPQIAPIILRAMADVHITLAWILSADTKARSARFVEDGLGAMKLEVAHREAQLKSMDDGEEKEDQQSLIDHLQAWIDSQRLDQLIEVNLGSWSGQSTRAMAEEAGCLDFYNYVYQPFSAAVHSSWSHLGRFNVVTCENPAHRYHRMPAMPEFEPDPHWLYLAAKYLQKAFARFDEWSGTETSVPAALDVLLDLLASQPEPME